MGTDTITPPKGFVIDSVPKGFVLDEPVQKTESPIDVHDRATKVWDMSKSLEMPPLEIDKFYDLLDGPKSFGLPLEEPVKAKRPVNTPDDTGERSYSGQLIGSTIELARYLSDMPRRLVMFFGQVPAISGSKVGIYREPREGMTPDEIRQSQIYQIADVLSKRAKIGTDYIFNQHPEWKQNPPENFKDLITSPKKLSQNVLRAVPLLAGAGFSIAAGQPWMAFALMFSSEAGNAKEEFIARGASEDEAERASAIYGFVAAGIENLQIGHGIKLLGNIRNIILHRSARKLAAKSAGRSITKELIMTSVLEATEEMSQGTWQDIIGKVMLDQPIEGFWGFVDQRAQEALIATALTMATGGLGVAGTKISDIQVRKFTKALDTRKDRIRTSLQEGNVETAEKLMVEAVKEATGVDPSKALSKESPEITAAQKDLQEALKPIPAIREGATQAEISVIEAEVAAKPRRIKEASEALQQAQKEAAEQARTELEAAREKVRQIKETKQEIEIDEAVIEDVENLIAELEKPIVVVQEGARLASPESVSLEMQQRQEQIDVVKKRLVETREKLVDARARADELGIRNEANSEAIDAIDRTSDVLDKFSKMIKPFIIPEKKRDTIAKTAEGEIVQPGAAETSGQRQARMDAEKEIGLGERDILGGTDPIQLITQTLKEAKRVRPLTEAKQTAERKRRVAAAAATMEKSLKKGDPAEVAIGRSTGLLKGPLTNYNNLWTPIRDKLNAADPRAVESAFRAIGTNSNLQYFGKIDTKEAFRKLIDGESITFREADLIQAQFGIEMGEIAKTRVPVSSLADQALVLWRAGLLTGIKTSGLNTLSNMFHGLTETATDVPAAGIDSVLSLFTGKRTNVLTMRGTWGGVKEGTTKGWKYLKTGIDERHIAEKYDYQRVQFGDSKFAKALQAYEETVFHLLGAEDQPFYYGAKARSLFSQAYAQGKTQGLKGKDLETFVDNLVQKPTDEMLNAAVMDAEQAVFQNRTTLGDIFSAINKSSKTGTVLVPFSRTPSAVAMQIINYSPVGGIKTIAENINNFDQRQLTRGLGRATIGTGALWLGTQIFSAGRMTLDYPDNEKERELWRLEGKQPYSIDYGDGKWRKVETLGPVGSVLVVGGHFQRAMDEHGSPTKAIVEAMAGAGKTFSEQTAVRGLSEAAKAISEPETSFEKYFSGLAGSVVPTIVSDVARATDYTERRSTGPVERIQSRIPGVRKKLEPQINAFGQDMPRYGGNPLEVMIDPTRPSKIREDVVIDEVRRLWDKGIKTGATKPGDRDGYDVLTPKENTELWRRAGQLVYRATFDLINGNLDTIDMKYSELSDENKGKAIDKLVKVNTDMARAEVAKHKLSEGKTLEELEESGLVTQDVIRAMVYKGL